MTVNYGLRYERINPFTEIEDRLNAFVPGAQSHVRPDAPRGLLFPGDAGIGKGIAQSANAFMPRVGVAWDPTGDGIWSVRASYGLFYDQFQNGAGTASQVAISAMPCGAVQPVQRRRPQLPEPVSRARRFPSPNTFVRPSTRVRARRGRQAAVGAELERRRAARRSSTATSSRRATSAPAGTHLPRNVEANPAVYGPGATAQNADRRRIYANCPADGSACDFSTIAMLRNITRVELPRRPGQPVAPLRRRASASTCRTGSRSPTTTCRR